MRITRNTRRADGQTVGEAMDRDAAALRALGIPARDGAATIDERREDFEEEIKAAVLAALDEVLAARGLKGDGWAKGSGWTDADLPALFPALEAHAARLWDRFFPSAGFDPRTREERQRAEAGH